MGPGTIVARDVSRSFRVHSQPRLTLKEAIVRRGRGRATDVWALRDVSFEIEPGEAVALVGRNGSGKTTLLRLIASIFKPTGGVLETTGSVGSLLALGAGFHPEFTGRENAELAGSIYGFGRGFMRERFEEIVAFAELEDFIDMPVRTYSSGMFMRLGFSLATHLSADVLLLDEVFAVGDEAFQRKCFGKIFEFKARGGTIVFVSHSATAVESLCERAILLRGGEVEYDGRAHDAIRRYQQQLADDQEPSERAVGLREWGSGEAHIASTKLHDRDGNERQQFLSGEPLVARITVEGRHDTTRPRLLVELRDHVNALLAASTVEAAELGWDGSPGEFTFEFALDAVPLVDGRFQLCVAVLASGSEHVYHRVDGAAEFIVYPDRDDARGILRFEPNWGRVENASAEVAP
jgi:ABC-type polysaccharide/polyol phosphate transport system ATPase subunit